LQKDKTHFEKHIEKERKEEIDIGLNGENIVKKF
jgi:hypothetical protein